MKKSLENLHTKKVQQTPIVMVTAYDFPTAKIQDEAGVDAILIGDSVGTNMLGYDSEQSVTMADMIHHTAAVCRGVKNAYTIADLPFETTGNETEAHENSLLLLAQGVDCVKLEGWREKAPVVDYLTKKNIEVCAHIGYNPQIHGAKPRTFGKIADQALDLIESALALQDAGAKLIVLEKIPVEIAEIISRKLIIPAIGIGSGNRCDGQVLVANDLLGMSPDTFRHARRYLDFYGSALDAFRRYKADVVKRLFPAEENSWHIDPAELEKVKNTLK